MTRSPTKEEIHRIPVGKIGIVSHQSNSLVYNYWQPVVKDSKWAMTSRLGEVVYVDDVELELVGHIPSGSPVIVLAISAPYKSKGKILYKVLWGDVICWIASHLVFNPYVHDQFKDLTKE